MIRSAAAQYRLLLYQVLPAAFGVTVFDGNDCLLFAPWASIAVTLKVYFALLASPVTVAVVAGASTVTGGCATEPRYAMTSYLAAAGAPALADAFQLTVAFPLPAVTFVIIGAPGPSVGVFGAAGFVVGGAACVVGGADCAAAEVASTKTRSPAQSAPTMVPNERWRSRFTVPPLLANPRSVLTATIGDGRGAGCRDPFSMTPSWNLGRFRQR